MSKYGLDRNALISSKLIGSFEIQKRSVEKSAKKNLTIKKEVEKNKQEILRLSFRCKGDYSALGAAL
ncbi:MAG: hypothetical protein OQK45_03500 [Sulfurovum sp.]|nr:hypothetical protein [Sulfurovum sp.]